MKKEEIERKYLVHTPPENLDQYPKEEIVQGYIVIAPDGTEVRLRRKGIKFYLTVKGGGTEVRPETEIKITEEQFNILWPTTAGKRIEKTRYKIPHKNKNIELDIYHGNLRGLITAEVEFANEDESKQFEPPQWFGEEVTKRLEYKNQNLALFGLPAY